MLCVFRNRRRIFYLFLSASWWLWHCRGTSWYWLKDWIKWWTYPATKFDLHQPAGLLPKCPGLHLPPCKQSFKSPYDPTKTGQDRGPLLAHHSVSPDPNHILHTGSCSVSCPATSECDALGLCLHSSLAFLHCLFLLHLARDGCWSVCTPDLPCLAPRIWDPHSEALQSPKAQDSNVPLTSFSLVPS